LAVVGSGAMFSDQFLDKEDNNKIKDVIFDFLTSDNFRLNEIDADDPEISDYNMVPVSSVSGQHLSIYVLSNYLMW
jgi:intraflagellar transport protein 52